MVGRQQSSSGRALAALLGLLLACRSSSSLQPPSAVELRSVAAGLGGAAASAAQQRQQLLGGRPAAPPVWPARFSATLFQNRTNRLALTTLLYDWELGANLNIIQSQLGAAGTVYDLEWNNGTSFIFSRDEPVCKVLTFEVGILQRDWLAGATYLGQTDTDTFVADVWTKAEFINYYADAATAKPVRWTFLWSGAEFHVLLYQELPRPLPKRTWAAPPYCFQLPNGSAATSAVLDQPLATGRLLRLLPARQRQRPGTAGAGGGAGAAAAAAS